MDEKFFERQFSALKGHIDARMDGIEKKMDGLEKRMDGIEKGMDSAEKLLQQVWIEVEAIRGDMRLVAEGHVMLGERFGRFESEYIRHVTDIKHDVLTLYKLTYGELERRVKELEKSRIS